MLFWTSSQVFKTVCMLNFTSWHGGRVLYEINTLTFFSRRPYTDKCLWSPSVWVNEKFDFFKDENMSTVWFGKNKNGSWSYCKILAWAHLFLVINTIVVAKLRSINLFTLYRPCQIKLSQSFINWAEGSQFQTVTNTIQSCNPVCQIRKISSLFGTLGHKQSRQWDFRTYLNFPDHYLKRSIILHLCV